MELKDTIYTKEKGIARVTINRPEVRNALNIRVREELREIVGELQKDKDVRVAIITGAGDEAFISGADITFFKGAKPVAIEEYGSALGQALYTSIETLDIPVIAMINGFCFGGGLELAMCCDIRVASEKAKFGQLEINVGIIPGGGGTVRLPRLVGWGRAKEMIYTGRIIDANEAGRIGLVDKVVPPDKLEEEVNQLATNIAKKSPLLIKLAKKTINKAMYTDLAAGLSYEKAMFSLCFSTEDNAEGINAFLEKRKPEFKGK
ncbi:MAG: enoyl-CoA hydratase-related protein [Chloroflexota bacterium]